MKCPNPACQQRSRVLITKVRPTTVERVRECPACWRRWRTEELLVGTIEVSGDNTTNPVERKLQREAWHKNRK